MASIPASSVKVTLAVRALRKSLVDRVTVLMLLNPFCVVPLDGLILMLLSLLVACQYTGLAEDKTTSAWESSPDERTIDVGATENDATVQPESVSVEPSELKAPWAAPAMNTINPKKNKTIPDTKTPSGLPLVVV